MTTETKSTLPTDSRSESSHTPGPWHIGIGGMLHANRVWTKDMRPVVNLCSMGTAPADLDPEAQANGRLIATAPDLLAALKEMGDWIAGGLQASDEAWPDAQCLKHTEEIAARARAAVDKAEGR